MFDYKYLIINNHELTGKERYKTMVQSALDNGVTCKMWYKVIFFSITRSQYLNFKTISLSQPRFDNSQRKGPITV